MCFCAMLCSISSPSSSNENALFRELQGSTIPAIAPKIELWSTLLRVVRPDRRSCELPERPPPPRKITRWGLSAALRSPHSGDGLTRGTPKILCLGDAHEDPR